MVFLEGHCAGCGKELAQNDLVVRFPALRVLDIDLPIVQTTESSMELLIHIDCFRYVFIKPL